MPAKTLELDPPFRRRIYDSIAETIGNTLLVRVARLARAHGARADVVLKLELFNPLGSVKDRIGVSMIEALEADGRVGPDRCWSIRPPANTGIALAFVCAARGYRLIPTMPESMSIERRKLLAFLGAELERTAALVGEDPRRRSTRRQRNGMRSPSRWGSTPSAPRTVQAQRLPGLGRLGAPPQSVWHQASASTRSDMAWGDDPGGASIARRAFR